jgi:hypothetical protein
MEINTTPLASQDVLLNGSKTILPPEAIDLLGKAFFLEHNFSLKAESTLGKSYFFHISGFTTNSWKVLTKEIFLNMSEKKPFWKKPIASHYRPVCIANRNYFQKFPNPINSKKLHREHIFGLMYFSSYIDCLDEETICERIKTAKYSKLSYLQAKDLDVTVSSHAGGSGNAFGVTMNDFILNAAKAKETYMLPFAPTKLKYKNNAMVIDQYFNKYEDAAFKIAASPDKYI